VDTRADYDDVFGIYVPIGIAVFAVFLFLFVFTALRWRRREGDDSGAPAPRSAAPLAEGLYALVLAAIAAFLIAATYHVENREDTLTGTLALQVDVTASDWHWRFDYPGRGVTRESDGPGPSVLVVPTNAPVRFTMSSLDVIHAFWVPELRFKRDAFPHRTTRFDLVFDKPGIYGGECAEFCGLGHAGMRFRIEAMSLSDFRDWLRTEQRGT
jgi:cytochrome c oxidase subunit 2